VGTVVVATDQAGNSNYQAATQVSRSIVAAAASLSLNVSSLSFGSVPVSFTSSAQTLIVSNANAITVPIAAFRRAATSTLPATVRRLPR
jgi:hypothetical protein